MMNVAYDSPGNDDDDDYDHNKDDDYNDDDDDSPGRSHRVSGRRGQSPGQSKVWKRPSITLSLLKPSWTCYICYIFTYPHPLPHKAQSLQATQKYNKGFL